MCVQENRKQNKAFETKENSRRVARSFFVVFKYYYLQQIRMQSLQGVVVGGRASPI